MRIADWINRECPESIRLSRSQPGHLTSQQFLDRVRVARSLRRKETDAEKRLWWALRARIPGYRFRRQHPIGRFIVDFACPSSKLIIEIDGSQHILHQQADAQRAAELARAGYRVISSGATTC